LPMISAGHGPSQKIILLPDRWRGVRSSILRGSVPPILGKCTLQEGGGQISSFYLKSSFIIPGRKPSPAIVGGGGGSTFWILILITSSGREHYLVRINQLHLRLSKETPVE